MFGEDNEPVVRRVVAAAAALDRRFCGALQNLALLCRARALLQAATGSARGTEAAPAGSAEGGSNGAHNEPARQLLALLQDEPALPVARDSEGRSLWHDLAAGGQPDLLRLLLPAADGTAVAATATASSAAQPAAAAAAAGGDGSEQAVAVAPAAAGQHPNPLNLPDLKGSTPLHAAAEGCHLEVARLLLGAGASPDVQNRRLLGGGGGGGGMQGQQGGRAVQAGLCSLAAGLLHIACFLVLL